MDRLVDLLNSIRSNSSSRLEPQLVSFMEEAQCSARSEETLAQVVHTIYSKAVSDRSFAATAAKLCDRMAHFIVDGTKFRSLLLNTLQVRAQGQTTANRRFRFYLTTFSNFSTRILSCRDISTYPKLFLRLFLDHAAIFCVIVLLLLFIFFCHQWGMSGAATPPHR